MNGSFSEPIQPQISEWYFIDELKEKKRFVPWFHRATCAGDEVSLIDGVLLINRFNCSDDLLDTAFADLDNFFDRSKIGRSGKYSIIISHSESLSEDESYEMNVGFDACRISASGAEGIRRALVFLQDEIIRSGGPFLRLGKIQRRPLVATRISRCFFGPIRRPPFNRNELIDDIDYYPDEYLLKLSHEGVNGLWITFHMDELCPAGDLTGCRYLRDRMIEKLKKTVRQCSRFGIKLYLYCSEPRAISVNGQLALEHPEVVGGHFDRDLYYFCPSSNFALSLIEESFHSLFRDVPGLGGIINITIGECGTHCYSLVPPGSADCPRCKGRSAEEVVNSVMSAIERGVHSASPDAKCIAWPYNQYSIWGDAATIRCASATPCGVDVLMNFESGSKIYQCGREISVSDYWLSFSGPSDVFRRSAEVVVGAGNKMFAKLQVSCSHEVATVPFVPVPGILFEKYRAIHELNITGVLQCWYFGGDPGLMGKAAGELSFSSPCHGDERAFLIYLARLQWGPVAETAVDAWFLFRSAYANFPLNHIFGWFGPMHDAPAWELLLFPEDRIIPPSYLLASQTSGEYYRAGGDRIGEFIQYTHTIDEVIDLCARLSLGWKRGVEKLREVERVIAARGDLVRELEVAEALSIQFESGYNLIRFYEMRERLPWESDYLLRVGLLEEMMSIARRERENSLRLADLCDRNSRLGFHPEAEGYKYFPEKLRWRASKIDEMFHSDGFPRILNLINGGGCLWGEYSGMAPSGPISVCNSRGSIECECDGDQWLDLQFGSNVSARPIVRWSSCYDADFLFVSIQANGSFFNDEVSIFIEPRRLWPVQKYRIRKDGVIWSSGGYDRGRRSEWRGSVRLYSHDCWCACFVIPFARLRSNGNDRRPMRIDVERVAMNDGQSIFYSWMERHPIDSRQIGGTDNPADLGWLIFM